MLIEHVERQALADRQGLIARGATEGLPTFGARQAAFDEALLAEPGPVERLDPEQLELRQALGVA